MESFTNTKPLLSIKQLAYRLNVAEKTIRNWVTARKIPYIKVGGAVRFDPVTIEKRINSGFILHNEE